MQRLVLPVPLVATFASLVMVGGTRSGTTAKKTFVIAQTGMEQKVQHAHLTTLTNAQLATTISI
jgi:tRNA splicing endonuclease